MSIFSVWTIKNILVWNWLWCTMQLFSNSECVVDDICVLWIRMWYITWSVEGKTVGALLLDLWWFIFFSSLGDIWIMTSSLGIEDDFGIKTSCSVNFAFVASSLSFYNSTYSSKIISLYLSFEILWIQNFKVFCS